MAAPGYFVYMKGGLSMVPIQTILLLYTGMLIESPQRREQLMKFFDGAGKEVEKVVNNFSKKKPVTKNDTEPEPTEPAEFH